jgi:uncharacterized protein
MDDSPLTSLDKSEPLRFFRSPGLASAFIRLCIYLVLVEAVTFGLARLARFFLGQGHTASSPESLAAAEVIAFASALSAAWVMSRLEKRSLGEYGLPLREAFRKRFWQGTLFGVAEISLAIGALAALGYYHFGRLAIHGSELLRWAAFWVLAFVFVGLYEEFAFRGYVQFTLGGGTRFWPAAVVLSLLFGYVHTGSGNYGETWAGIADVVLTGLFWCFTLRRTGNLWFAVGMHASFDFGESFLYSVPDSGVLLPGHLSNATVSGPSWLSGGTAGPEGSVFDVVILLLLFVVFHFLFPATAPGSSPAEPGGETSAS